MPCLWLGLRGKAGGEMSRLDDLYSQIPKFKCIEGCTDCCGPIPANLEEIKRIGKKPGVTHDVPGLLCEFAKDGPCSIYENRPLVCRIFGTVPSEPLLKCPHGCQPMFPMIKEQENQIMDEYEKTFTKLEKPK